VCPLKSNGLTSDSPAAGEVETSGTSIGCVVQWRELPPRSAQMGIASIRWWRVPVEKDKTAGVAARTRHEENRHSLADADLSTITLAILPTPGISRSAPSGAIGLPDPLLAMAVLTSAVHVAAFPFTWNEWAGRS